MGQDDMASNQSAAQVSHVPSHDAKITAVHQHDIEIVDWNGPNDPENPFNWSKPRKLLITILCLTATMTCTMNGTALTVAWKDTNEHFGISDEHFPNSYWPVASWTIGGAVFMMVFLPLMEDFSVRWGYLASYVMFLLFVFPQALVQNFAGFIVIRFFAGGFVSLVANCIVGICCDIWEGERGRSVPVASYITVYLSGSSLGPVMGAAVLTTLHWKWIIWIQLIFYTSLLPLFILLLPETRGSNILRARARSLRRNDPTRTFSTTEDLDRSSPLDTLRTSLSRPFHLFFTEWVVFSFTIWSSFAVGLVYLFTQSTEQVFSHLYGWTSIQAGLIQSAIVLGMCLAWIANFYQINLYFASAARNSESPGDPIPEAHLYHSILGCFLGCGGGMFLYAWSSTPSVPWPVPALGLLLVGYGINAIVIAVAAYVTACYSKYAVSAVASVCAGENLFAALLPLAASTMYSKLGFGWASTLLGLFSVVLGGAPVVMLFWGRQIRTRSPFISEARYGEGREGSCEGLVGRE
ncbi:hypothetical protein CAC42_6939 [Sphaceloma murrayae]|uniref:Major facilitator superfamily (MFS) profile domain-containing protein n=1 Tax=Sphaceloma murrayae TaxID=2082308 RepID=A0A2K1QQ84_9PEZI|nr:hypothetical protein CAC42_6939 [Sphaceloma murrayae]